jgi:hypothetical protein
MRNAREIWVQIVGQFERSTLTQAGFAEERNLPVATLRYWIYRVRRERAEEVAPILPVRVIGSPALMARGREVEGAAIEVELGEPLRLRFAAGTPAATIAELVSLLRARC